MEKKTTIDIFYGNLNPNARRDGVILNQEIRNGNVEWVRVDDVKNLSKVIQMKIAERTAEGLFGDKKKISIEEICDIIRSVFKNELSQSKEESK